MPSFSNPQVKPFRYDLTEPDSPLQVWAERAEDNFIYRVDNSRFRHLESMIGAELDWEDTDQVADLDFWRQVLDYGPHEEPDYVTLGEGPPLPKDLFDCWPDNTRYEYDVWFRARAIYENWLCLYHQLALPSKASGAPQELAYRQLEYELSQSLPSRVLMLQRLHLLGLLCPDQPSLDALLERLPLPRLRAWRRAALLHRWVSEGVEGMLEDQDGTVLASPVGVEWFLDGPYQQRFLDPLAHLRFALHEHLKREPPAQDSSFVVSMGGRISGAFFYQLGPGKVPQLVRGGEPQHRSPRAALYPRELSDGGDRMAEMAGRAIRAGFYELGMMLAASWLRRKPTHGQCWVELAVALFRQGEKSIARCCLDKADDQGHVYQRTGELAPILEISLEEHQLDLERHLGVTPERMPNCLRDLALAEEVWDCEVLAALIGPRVPDFVRA